MSFRVFVISVRRAVGLPNGSMSGFSKRYKGLQVGLFRGVFAQQ